jgi:pimeloyl-ACP methyl ester carboxylesterase
MLAILGAILVADAIFRVYAVRIAQPIFETPPPFHVERHPVDPAAEVLRIPVGPDRTLAAALFFPETSPDGRAARGVVVFCPELGSDRWSAPAYCRGLLDLGYLVLAFDFRGQGESDPGPDGHRPHHWLTEVEVTDVMAAVERTARDERLAGLPLTLFGVSRGAGAALVAASRLSAGRACCVVADGAYSARTMMMFFFNRWAGLYVPDWMLKLLPRWHVASTLRIVEWCSARRRPTPFAHVEPALRKLKRVPVFMISGERDSYVLPRFTLRLQRITRQPKERAWVVPGAKHNGNRRADPVEYDRRLIEFIEAAGGSREPTRETPRRTPSPTTPETRRPATAAMVATNSTSHSR